MKKIFAQLLLVVMIFQLLGCTAQMKMANGAYSDISLTRSEQKYSVVRLKEVNGTGSAIFGIPNKPSSKQRGFIYRFNGINLSEANSFFPTLSMIGLSFFGGAILDNIAGYKTETINGIEYETDKKKLGLVLSTILSIPVAGVINNYLWPNSAYQVASFNVNNKLIKDNTNIDVFLNPKYEISNRISLWSQKSIINANVMGAIIKEDTSFLSIDDENMPVTVIEPKVSSGEVISEIAQKDKKDKMDNDSIKKRSKEQKIFDEAISLQKELQENTKGDKINNISNEMNNMEPKIVDGSKLIEKNRLDSLKKEQIKIELYNRITRKYKVGDKINYYSAESSYQKMGKVVNIDMEYVTIKPEDSDELLKMPLKSADN